LLFLAFNPLQPIIDALIQVIIAINGVIHNLGWSLIALALLIRLAFLPLTFFQFKSMAEMQRIQPLIKALQAKHKGDSQKLNTEMMALYKEHNVNMYGGCLPLLIQMPLFFAYFRVLQNTVELRQAHWFWLHDLSNPDPLYILPVLIIVSMFLTQFITPSPGMDPTQRKIMAFIMPLFFGYTLMRYASGLALYWCTGNLINLAIQVSINQSHIGKEMHAIAAKRAAKKKGNNPPMLPGRR
jgi:YidC/Oxa1 family membrane protein insertase